MGNYILLPDGTTRREDDVVAWGRWFEKADRRVAQTDLGDKRVSTVFLGIDHSMGVGPPLLFETMVFEANGDSLDCERCSTFEQAVTQHIEVCARHIVASLPSVFSPWMPVKPEPN